MSYSGCGWLRENALPYTWVHVSVLFLCLALNLVTLGIILYIGNLNDSGVLLSLCVLGGSSAILLLAMLYVCYEMWRMRRELWEQVML